MGVAVFTERARREPAASGETVGKRTAETTILTALEHLGPGPARSLGQHREDCLPAVLRVPAPVSRQRRHDLQPPALFAVRWRVAPARAVGGGVRYDDGYCRRVPGARERYPDRLGAVAGDVLYRVGDESDVMISASAANSASPWKPSAARTCKRAIRTDSGMPGKTNAISRGSTSTVVLAMASSPFRAGIVAACTSGTGSRQGLPDIWQLTSRPGNSARHATRHPRIPADNDPRSWARPR